MPTITLTRQQLYDRAWTTPLDALAKELGLSGRGLGKVCERHDIPVPPRGWWAKKAAGHRVRQTPLPAASAGMATSIRFSVITPQANGYCERFIGTARRECLDWMIPLHEEHLRRVLAEWIPHYNGERPHSALGPGLPDKPTGRATLTGRSLPPAHRVVASARLGGLHHHYRFESRRRVSSCGVQPVVGRGIRYNRGRDVFFRPRAHRALAAVPPVGMIVMADELHFDGDPAEASRRRHLERVIKGEPRRRWPWVMALLAGSAWTAWRMTQPKSEPQRNEDRAADRRGR